MTDSTAIQKYLESPRDFPAYIHQTHDFMTGVEIVNYIHSMVIGADSIMDIVIKSMEQEWTPQEHDGEQFYDFMVRSTELAPVTIQRHTRVGEMLALVPETYRPQIEGKDVKSKVRMTDAILDGYEVNEEQWQRLAEASNYEAVGEVIREVKDECPRKQWMKFTVDEHDIVWVHTAEGVFEYMRINTDPEIKDVVERANKRLFRAAGITPRVRY